MRLDISKYIIFGLLLSDLVALCHGQRNKRKPKPKSSGKFIPGRSRLSPATSSRNPRGKSPTLGEILRRGQQTQRRPPPNQNGENSDWTPVNYFNNVRNGFQTTNNHFRANPGNEVPVHYPTIGKVIPPLRRREGEKPPFAPSWTHCVISVQVSIAWVIVTSPGYPNKFQGQVQCSWIATAPDGYGIRLSFKAMDLLPPNGNGCGNQFVEVIDMSLEKSQSRFCGKHTPGDYVSSGSKLRLDLQADAISTPYKGFMAAFRADQEVPGRRETSYFANGQPQGLYNPLTEAPPSNPRMPRQRNARKPPPKQQMNSAIAGQRIYGRKDQPRFETDKETPDENALESSSTHLYIIIAVVIVILVTAVSTYIFKRFFYKQAKLWWKKRKQKRASRYDEDPYALKKMQLPGSMPLPPTPGRHSKLSRHSSFNGTDSLASFNSEMYPQSRPPSYGQAISHFNRSPDADEFGTEWNQEPIYEDDNLSLHSVASSIRSSNRHPDHERFKHQKLLERANSMRVRSNSLDDNFNPYSTENAVYQIYNPYRSNSYHGTHGYNQSDDLYGSLPPTFGPGHSNMYDLYGSRSAQPSSARQLYTSSTTDIPGNITNHNDFMMQQYRGRSASMYDLTTAGLVQNSNNPPQSPTPNQRLVSVSSSTTSTNPILKKTKPVQQNELAFSALRAAKSMNDLTAINTKLNECVSWTLPSQRRQSFVEFRE